jgi:tetratricopeptide (TPR) repeat protein
MIRKASFLAMTFVIASFPVFADDIGLCSFCLTPGASFPFVDSAELFDVGGLASAEAEFGFPRTRLWFASAGVDLQYNPIANSTAILSVLNANAGLGACLEISPRISIKARAGGGYYFASTGKGGSSGSYPSFSGGLDFAFILNPSFDIGFETNYHNYLGLYHGISVALQSSFYFSGRGIRMARIESGETASNALVAGAIADRQGFGLDMEQLEIDDIFPVFKSVYGDRPLGHVVLKNKEESNITEISLTFFAKQFMDAPKECDVPETLATGESISADLTALFTDRVLEVTEGTMATAELTLEYRHDGKLFRDTRNITVRILDRNAMRWEDDRRAAAFVTAKDPCVMAFARNAVGLVRGKGPQVFDENILFAMAIFEALDLYGLAYVVDPKTPFADFSKNDKAVDYLQFPRQTLEYRAGDCDDLSILYAALLESVGIETAFVTVPGHIYLAFALETPAADLSRTFTSIQDIIIRDNRSWVPIEITVRGDSFIQAWAEGARQWRDAVSKNEAGFIPIHDAWNDYEPVGLPGASADVPLPPADRLLSAFLEKAACLVDREISPIVAKLQEDIRSNGGNPASYNRLGILYAKFGKRTQAEEAFTKALAEGDYMPALVNLGNLHFLNKELPEAQILYERAANLDPDSASVVVNLARVYYERELFDQARANHEKLIRLDPVLAARHSYLGATSMDTRAESGFSRASVVWGEEM